MKGILIEHLPELVNPIVIVGFDGWGNALNASKGMVDYLVQKMDAQYFAGLNSDVFFRYDESRPVVKITEGVMKQYSPVGGSFYKIRTESKVHDLVILSASEPALNWLQFIDEFFQLCRRIKANTVITIGSMYDNVLHTDRMLSCVASHVPILLKLKQMNVIPMNYQGPAAFHAAIQTEGHKKGLRCISLWAHCPYYLEGATHFGVLSALGKVLGFLGKFELDTQDLEDAWKNLDEKIRKLIDENPNVDEIVREIRKSRMADSLQNIRNTMKKGEKVIDLQDFLEFKKLDDEQGGRDEDNTDQ